MSTCSCYSDVGQNFWQRLVTKYEKRIQKLMRKRCEIRHRLEVMQLQMPAYLYYSMTQAPDKAGQQVKNFINQLQEPSEKPSGPININCTCDPCPIKIPENFPENLYNYKYTKNTNKINFLKAKLAAKKMKVIDEVPKKSSLCSCRHCAKRVTKRLQAEDEEELQASIKEAHTIPIVHSIPSAKNICQCDICSSMIPEKLMPEVPNVREMGSSNRNHTFANNGTDNLCSCNVKTSVTKFNDKLTCECSICTEEVIKRIQSDEVEFEPVACGCDGYIKPVAEVEIERPICQCNSCTKELNKRMGIEVTFNDECFCNSQQVSDQICNCDICALNLEQTPEIDICECNKNSDNIPICKCDTCKKASEKAEEARKVDVRSGCICECDICNEVRTKIAEAEKVPSFDTTCICNCEVCNAAKNIDENPKCLCAAFQETRAECYDNSIIMNSPVDSQNICQPCENSKESSVTNSQNGVNKEGSSRCSCESPVTNDITESAINAQDICQACSNIEQERGDNQKPDSTHDHKPSPVDSQNIRQPCENSKESSVTNSQNGINKEGSSRCSCESPVTNDITESAINAQDICQACSNIEQERGDNQKPDSTADHKHETNADINDCESCYCTQENRASYSSSESSSLPSSNTVSCSCAIEPSLENRTTEMVASGKPANPNDYSYDTQISNLEKPTNESVVHSVKERSRSQSASSGSSENPKSISTNESTKLSDSSGSTQTSSSEKLSASKEIANVDPPQFLPQIPTSSSEKLSDSKNIAHDDPPQFLQQIPSDIRRGTHPFSPSETSQISERFSHTKSYNLEHQLFDNVSKHSAENKEDIRSMYCKSCFERCFCSTNKFPKLMEQTYIRNASMRSSSASANTSSSSESEKSGDCHC